MKFVLPGLALFALLLTGPSGTALAQPSTPQEQLRFKNLTVARANPLGLISVTDGSYRFRLYESDSPLFKDNFIGVGGQVVLTPASDDPDARNYSTSGWQFSGLAEFRFKVGPMAVRDTFRAGRPDYDVRDGDQLYYEPLFDLLIPNGGWFVNNDVDLLYLTGRWKLGARWTYATAFYRDGDFPVGVGTEDPNNPTNRVGPFLTYTFPSKKRLFQDPTLVFIANWWLEHRFRTGEDVTQAFPYIILGITFDGDLYSSET